ncbi:MAG: FMN-binding protein [Firmicutes bacterium]|nr:FMN-binding protein [Bacillota bacterium]
MLKKSMVLLLAVLFLSSTAVLASYRDGTYIGEASGHNGPIQVEVTVANGQIIDIQVLRSEETPIISDAAFAGVSQEIIDRQVIDVATVTGATVSSRAMIAAVNSVLKDSIASTELVFKDGVFTGTAQGFNAPVKVQVTIEGGKLSKIDVVEHAETPGLGDRAFNVMIPKMIDAQSVEVDTVSGATISSEALIDAIRDALN